jgi:hypothetical protein
MFEFIFNSIRPFNSFDDSHCKFSVLNALSFSESFSRYILIYERWNIIISFGFSLCITKKQVDELLDAVDRTFTKWEKKIDGKG